jgi:predicted ATP-grasp superfamily ATP-dependent carboligase
VSAFVTDGDQRATLAVVRALGQAGIPVTVGSSQPGCLAGSSRYCRKQICYAPPLTRGPNFQAQVLNEVVHGRHRVLIPMTDVTMRLVGEIRKTLEPLVHLGMPTAERIEQAQDKRAVLWLAEKAGIASPRTFMLHAHENLADVARKIRYPAVIKSRFSWWLRDGRWVAGHVRYAHDAEELVAQYQESHALIPEPLVQEKVDGEGRGVFLLVWNGELKAAFSHRRLREKPPWGGVSVLRESTPLDRQLVDKSFELLRILDWQGPAMVEFKVDSRDGEPKLMEVNGRFWGSLQLASDAGINFPLMLYRLASGEEVPNEFDYQAGVKSRWLLGDLDHLWIRLKHSQADNGFSGNQRSKLRTLLDFMKLYEPHLHYEIFRFHDPAPGWFECKSYVRDLLRKPAQPRDNADCPDRVLRAQG